jgi:hypothetical protein
MATIFNAKLEYKTNKPASYLELDIPTKSADMKKLVTRFMLNKSPNPSNSRFKLKRQLKAII